MRRGKDYVEKMLPHRDPMRLIDSVEELTPEQSIVASFYVDPNREIFKGHFPGNPILPGVYTVECMGQASSILAADMDQYYQKTPLFFGIDNVRLVKKVLPGSTLLICSALEKEDKERNMLTFQSQVKCKDDIVASGTVIIAMR